MQEENKRVKKEADVVKEFMERKGQEAIEQIKKQK